MDQTIKSRLLAVFDPTDEDNTAFRDDLNRVLRLDEGQLVHVIDHLDSIRVVQKREEADKTAEPRMTEAGLSRSEIERITDFLEFLLNHLILEEEDRETPENIADDLVLLEQINEDERPKLAWIINALARKVPPVAETEVWKGRAEEFDSLRIPPALRHIGAAILKSYDLTKLSDNWDGEGALAVNKNAWLRAAKIVVENSKRVWQICRKPPPAPTIMPGFEGGIAVDWEGGLFGLLLEVPPDVNESASFYGDNRAHPKTESTSGQIGPDTVLHPGVASWLAQMV